MVSFVFRALEPLAGPSAGLGLCDLTVAGNDGVVSSQSYGPKASMMIVPSVASLLFCAARILSDDRRTVRTVFTATASPFSLTFRRGRKGVQISAGRTAIDHGGVASFATAVRHDVGGFAAMLLVALPPEETGVGDLRDALVACQADDDGRTGR